MAYRVEERLAVLRTAFSADTDPLVGVERAALFFLSCAGVESNEHVLAFKPRASFSLWEVWCADSIVFTVHSIRAERWREALRGWGQVREYAGRNGGFLPSAIADCSITLQNVLEDKIGPR